MYRRVNPRVRHIFVLGARIAGQSGKKVFGSEHSLLAMLDGKDDLASEVLSTHGITADRVANHLRLLDDNATQAQGNEKSTHSTLKEPSDTCLGLFTSGSPNAG